MKLTEKTHSSRVHSIFGAIFALCLVALMFPTSTLPQTVPQIVEDFEGSLALPNLDFRGGSTLLGGFLFPWSTVYQVTAISNERSFPAGGRSLKADYNGFTEGSIGISKSNLPSTLGNEIYARFYIQLREGFKYPLNQKILLVEGNGWYFNHQIQGNGGNNNHYTIIESEGNRTGWQRYTGNIYTPGKWFYVEYRIKRNSSGASNGAVERWWRNVSDDGPLNHDIEDLSVNLIGNNANPINAVRFLATYSSPDGVPGNANTIIYLDSIAVGTARIGELPQSPDRTPPAAPAGLRIQ